MKRDDALRILRANHDALVALGVQSLSLFCSVARDEAGPTSDVDVLVEFSGPATFHGYMDVLEHLEEQLGRTVDLVMMNTLKPRIRPYVEKEMIRVA
jgi:uncharacterized protein